MMVVMLDRERNEDGDGAVRDVGARLRLISHGDVSASLLAVSDNSPVDVMFGIGGTPEGVISAAATKCLGGGFVGRLWPRDDGEREAAVAQGYDLERQLDQDALVKGNDCFFAATGVTDGDVLQGVRYPTPRARRRRSRSSCARARTPCGASRRATTARSCAHTTPVCTGSSASRRGGRRSTATPR